MFKILRDVGLKCKHILRGAGSDLPEADEKGKVTDQGHQDRAAAIPPLPFMCQF